LSNERNPHTIQQHKSTEKQPDRTRNKIEQVTNLIRKYKCKFLMTKKSLACQISDIIMGVITSDHICSELCCNLCQVSNNSTSTGTFTFLQTMLLVTFRNLILLGSAVLSQLFEYIRFYTLNYILQISLKDVTCICY
jgi:hypothetical protein